VYLLEALVRVYTDRGPSAVWPWLELVMASTIFFVLLWEFRGEKRGHKQ
jgi:uncharacterized membrane protein